MWATNATQTLPSLRLRLPARVLPVGVHDAPADHGEQRMDRADVLHRRREVVLAQDGEIGDLAHFERAEVATELASHLESVVAVAVEMVVVMETLIAMIGFSVVLRKIWRSLRRFGVRFKAICLLM